MFWSGEVGRKNMVKWTLVRVSEFLTPSFTTNKLSDPGEVLSSVKSSLSYSVKGSAISSPRPVWIWSAALWCYVMRDVVVNPGKMYKVPIAPFQPAHCSPVSILINNLIVSLPSLRLSADPLLSKPYCSSSSPWTVCSISHRNLLERQNLGSSYIPLNQNPHFNYPCMIL